MYYYARAGARAFGSCKNEPENADFPAGKSRKKCENDENWEKNFFPRSGKNMKIIPTERKRSRKTDDPDEKKQQIFSQAEGKMQKRTRKKQKNYLSNHPQKGMKNIRPIGINSVINGRSG